jgi:hypothetical protein
MRKTGIDLADPHHPRVPITKAQADLLLVLIKVDFAIRISGAVKAGGARRDPSAVMDTFQISDNLELVIAVSYLLLSVYGGLIDSIPCPLVLRAYLEELLNSKTLNDPEMMEANTDSKALYHMVLEHKADILAALAKPTQTFTQFSIKGPARA